VLNSDAKEYRGCGHGNFGGAPVDFLSWHGRPYSLRITLLPLAALLFVSETITP
jgi:1,4-alpha-glucan branching enzyme